MNNLSEDPDLYEIGMTLCRVRDRVRQIAEGEIQRGKRESQYSIHPPGMRPIKLKDARDIAKHSVIVLNECINALMEIDNQKSIMKV